MKKEERFVKTYSQGMVSMTEIWVDRQSGVNYLFHTNGSAGGFTPLLDRDGKPIITTYIEEKYN